MERLIYASDRSRSNWPVLAGQANRLIRILQITVSCWEDCSVDLVSDPQGTPASLAGPIYCQKGLTHVRLGRRYALVAARDKGLGLTTAFRALEASHTVVLWYDVVS